MHTAKTRANKRKGQKRYYTNCFMETTFLRVADGKEGTCKNT